MQAFERRDERPVAVLFANDVRAGGEIAAALEESGYEPHLIQTFGVESPAPVSLLRDPFVERARLMIFVSSALLEGEEVLSGDPFAWESSIDAQLEHPLRILREVLPGLLQRKDKWVFHVTLRERKCHDLDLSIQRAVRTIAEALSRELLGLDVKNTWIDAELPEEAHSRRSALMEIASSIDWCASRPQRVKIQELVFGARP